MANDTINQWAHVGWGGFIVMMWACIFNSLNGGFIVALFAGIKEFGFDLHGLDLRWVAIKLLDLGYIQSPPKQPMKDCIKDWAFFMLGAAIATAILIWKYLYS